MTTDVYNPPAPKIVTGVGPYPFGFEFDDAAEIVVSVFDGVAMVALDAAAFTVSPEGGGQGGEVQLTADAATLWDQQELFIRRRTEVVQDWSNGFNPRELPLRISLDRIARGVQELRDGVDRSVKVYSGSVADLVPSAGRALIWSEDGNALVPGPNAEDIAGAQGYAAAALAAQTLAELAADAGASYAGAGVSLARVSATGNDSEAASAAIQLSSGAWYYPKPFATLDGAGDNTVAGDTIELQATQWTETGVTLRGGRVYNMPDVNLVNCEMTFSGSTETGPLVIRGKPTIRRTDSLSISLLVEDAVYDLDLTDIDDQNLAATGEIVAVRRSHGQGRYRDITTAYRCPLNLDAQWDDVAVGRYSDWYGRSIKSTYETANTASIVNLLTTINRGTKARFWFEDAHSENNVLFGIGALSDPPSAIETRLEIHSGKLTGAQEAFTYYGRAGTDDSYHVEIGSSAAVLTDSSVLTRRLNTAGGMTIAARGAALVSALPHSEVEGPTYGQFIVSEVA